MRGLKISSAGIGLVLAGLVTTSMSGPAAAGFRWDWRFRAPVYEYYPEQEYYEDDGSYDDAFYDELEEPIIRKTRRAKKQELWWTEDEEDFDPVYEEPVRKPKKKIVAKAKPKAFVKKQEIVGGEPLTDLSKARAKFGKKTDLKTAGLDPLGKALPKAKLKTVVKPKPKLQQTAGLDKQDKKPGKSIGCTAGAAVVTGYGFGSVKPKACTGDTYAYNAARAGKSYVIRLNAASGEILEVKKLN